MRRYVIASILIGLVSFGTVLLLHYTGMFGGFASGLLIFFQSSGLFQLQQPELAELRWLWLEWLLLFVVAFGIAWCVTDVAQFGQRMLVYLLTVIVVSGLSPTLALYGVLYSPFPAITAASLSLLIGLAYAGTDKGMRKRVLMNVLGERVSRGTFSSMVNSQINLPLQGDSYEATVLTCRLTNLAELKEKMKAADFVAMTKRFFHHTSDFLLSQGAYLDESSPDCVRVFFGLLVRSDDHASQACRTAFELRQRLVNLKSECESRWLQKPDYGVAISSGQMTVGVYGSPRRYYFGAVGQATDFSRRISMMNRIYGSVVLVDARAFQLAENEAEVRPMELVYDPESRVMTEVYELMGLSDNFDEQARRNRDVFWEAIILYREKEYDKALQKFSEVESDVTGEEDLPLKFFVELIQECLTHGDPGPGREPGQQAKGHARLLNSI